MADPAYYSNYGAERWYNWFNSDTTTIYDDDYSRFSYASGVFNTLCYHNSSSFVVRHGPLNGMGGESDMKVLPAPGVLPDES